MTPGSAREKRKRREADMHGRTVIDEQTGFWAVFRSGVMQRIEMDRLIPTLQLFEPVPFDPNPRTEIPIRTFELKEWRVPVYGEPNTWRACWIYLQVPS